MTPSLRVALLAAVSLLLAAAASCAKEEFAVLDLATDLHLAEFRRDTGVVNLGEPEARHVLMDGWFRSDRQWLDEEVRFVWGTGDRSRLRVWSFRDGARRLRLTGRPLLDVRGAPEVEVVMNGRRVDRFAMREGWSEYGVTLPEGALQLGGNELELRYHWGRQAPAGADTLRSVAWDRLRMGKPWVYGEPRADVLADGVAALVLPFFSQLDYYVRLRPGQSLRFGPVAVHGDQVLADGAALEVTVETEQAVLLETVIGAADFAGTQSIAVPVQESTIGRVSLRSRTDNDPQRESGLRIAAPRLVGIESPAAVTASEPPRWTAAERRPNVLIYLVDTLRADHLGVYGYDKDTSPSIDAFASDAVTFDRAYAQSGWTRSSVASIFTGMVPIAHGVLDRQDSMPEEAPLISRLFGELGYQTLGITTNGNVSKYFDFERGFDSYVYLGERKTREIHIPSAEVHARFLGWLDEADTERPFFAYLHSSDPHGPYTPRPPFDARFPSPGHSEVLQPHEIAEALTSDPALTLEQVRNDLIPLYDGEIAYNDHTFGQLLEALRQRGVYDDTVIVFVADHGEEFLDHGAWGHGKTLFTEMVQMPLLIKLPAQRNGGARTQALTQHIDLLPTLLEIAGGGIPEAVQGGSRVDALLDPAHAPGAPWVRSYLQLERTSLASVIVDGRQLIRPYARPENMLTSGASLFDLVADARQQRDLARLQPLIVGYLLTQLRLLEGADTTTLQAGVGTADEELLDRLRALGYLQ